MIVTKPKEVEMTRPVDLVGYTVQHKGADVFPLLARRLVMVPELRSGILSL